MEVIIITQIASFVIILSAWVGEKLFMKWLKS